ncbi:hypothetical protein FRB90_008409, partial [Tulasnella sp. 427]
MRMRAQGTFTHTNLDIQAIRQQTAAAQRSAYGPSSTSPQLARVPEARGYTSVHQNYQTIAAAAKATAYRPRGDQISFVVALRYLQRAKVATTVINGIYKQVTVPVNVCPAELKKICYDALKPDMGKWAGDRCPPLHTLRLMRPVAEDLELPELANEAVLANDAYAKPNGKSTKTQIVNGRAMGALKKTLNQGDQPFLAMTQDEYDELIERILDDGEKEQEPARHSPSAKLEVDEENTKEILDAAEPYIRQTRSRSKRKERSPPPEPLWDKTDHQDDDQEQNLVSSEARPSKRSKGKARALPEPQTLFHPSTHMGEVGDLGTSPSKPLSIGDGRKSQQEPISSESSSATRPTIPASFSI